MPLTDIAWTSLSDAKRCVTIVAANPAENGSAYCNIGTIARKMYLRIPPGPKRFPVKGLITAPKATTTTMITVVSNKTLLNSERKWRKNPGHDGRVPPSAESVLLEFSIESSLANAKHLRSLFAISFGHRQCLPNRLFFQPSQATSRKSTQAR